MSAYQRIITKIFFDKFRRGAERIPFTRDDIISAAKEIGGARPKNLGDVIYTFRFRKPLPEEIRNTQPKEREWIIRQRGDGLYVFVLVEPPRLEAQPGLLRTRIPDVTPGIITRYALDDEQALLAIVRYNRLIDIFTGVTCYSLQNHLRTKVPGLGQVEADEIYVGVDRHGAHYVFPVQAKGGRDKHSMVQIEQDIAMTAHKFPGLISRPIAVQFLRDHGLALMEFTDTEGGLKLVEEKHYELVDQEELSDEELAQYRQRGEI